MGQLSLRRTFLKPQCFGLDLFRFALPRRFLTSRVGRWPFGAILGFLGPELGLLGAILFFGIKFRIWSFFCGGGLAFVLFGLLEPSLKAFPSQIIFSCFLCLLEPIFCLVLF